MGIGSLFGTTTLRAAVCAAGAAALLAGGWAACPALAAGAAQEAAATAAAGAAEAQGQALGAYDVDRLCRQALSAGGLDVSVGEGEHLSVTVRDGHVWVYEAGPSGEEGAETVSRSLMDGTYTATSGDMTLEVKVEGHKVASAVATSGEVSDTGRIVLDALSSGYEGELGAAGDQCAKDVLAAFAQARQAALAPAAQGALRAAALSEALKAASLEDGSSSADADSHEGQVWVVDREAWDEEVEAGGYYLIHGGWIGDGEKYYDEDEFSARLEELTFLYVENGRDDLWYTVGAEPEGATRTVHHAAEGHREKGQAGGSAAAAGGVTWVVLSDQGAPLFAAACAAGADASALDAAGALSAASGWWAAEGVDVGGAGGVRQRAHVRHVPRDRGRRGLRRARPGRLARAPARPEGVGRGPGRVGRAGVAREPGVGGRPGGRLDVRVRVGGRLLPHPRRVDRRRREILRRRRVQRAVQGAVVPLRRERPH